MKRFSLIAASLVLASSAQAAFIQCTPGQQDVVVNATGTSATFTCNPGAGAGAGSADDNLAGDGWLVTSIRLRFSGTFQENNGPVGANYSVLFSGTNSGGYLNPANATATSTADANNQALAAITSTGGFFTLSTPTDFLSQFTITVTGGPGSNPLPFNGSASAFYEVTAVQPPPTVVPEPASLGLAALALAGLGLARRRK